MDSVSMLHFQHKNVRFLSSMLPLFLYVMRNEKTYLKFYRVNAQFTMKRRNRFHGKLFVKDLFHKIIVFLFSYCLVLQTSLH